MTERDRFGRFTELLVRHGWTYEDKSRGVWGLGDRRVFRCDAGEVFFPVGVLPDDLVEWMPVWSQTPSHAELYQI